MDKKEENVIYVTASADPIAIVLGVLAMAAFICANVFIFTMPFNETNGWIKSVIGLLFNFLWISNFFHWIILPLKSED